MPPRAPWNPPPPMVPTIPPIAPVIPFPQPTQPMGQVKDEGTAFWDDISAAPTPATSDKKRTIALIVIDQSGSMNSIREETRTELNKQLQVLREADTDEHEVSVVIVFFSSTVNKPLYWMARAKGVPDIAPDAYKPEGMTALYDAIGKTARKINAIPDAQLPDTAVLCIFLTDGMENASGEFSNGATLSGLLRDLQGCGRWTFTVLGANIDLANLATVTGIPSGNMSCYVATREGVGAAGQMMRASTTNYLAARNVGVTAVQDFYGGSSDDAA